jgi:hypothetical protein
LFKKEKDLIIKKTQIPKKKLNVDEKTKGILSAHEATLSDQTEAILESDAVILQQIHRLQTNQDSNNG